MGSIAPPRFLSNGQVGLVPGKTTGALVGKWTVDNEKATSDDAVATILLAAHAKEVNLVMATANGKPADAIVLLDGNPVPVDKRGADVHVDANGRTIVTVARARHVPAVREPDGRGPPLSISTTGPGLEAYDFTFG